MAWLLLLQKNYMDKYIINVYSQNNFFDWLGYVSTKLYKKFKKRIQITHINKGIDNSNQYYLKNGIKYITYTDLPLKYSAFKTLTKSQSVLLILAITIFLEFLIFSPLKTLIATVGVLTFIYFIDFIFTLIVMTRSFGKKSELKFTKEQLVEINDSILPKYTILCPLYRESEVIEQFSKAIEIIDWPKEKLEVLLLLEEDDLKTINKAYDLKLPSYFKIEIVPNSLPKTKPKACNWGLNKATGEYIVVYDAEDKPDPLQLKKAYIGFQKLPEKTACLQCKLNYYNQNQNILTRLFTAEYSYWFEIALPGLQSLDTIIPLGGTSNHFKTKLLKQLQGWDPFNVTEDCDLGTRLFKEGYKTSVIDSETLEEANSNLNSWIKQRSRWIKGYMQTYLVHMRNPFKFISEFKSHAIIFQLVIGMRMVFMIINPIMWLMTISYFLMYPIVGPSIESLYPWYIFYPAVFCLIIANFTYFYSYMIASAKKEKWELMQYIYLIPFYWIFTSVSAGIAFYQLITKPYYWEKTKHGLYLGEEGEQKIGFSFPKFVIEPSFEIPNFGLLKLLNKLSFSQNITPDDNKTDTSSVVYMNIVNNNNNKSILIDNEATKLSDRNNNISQDILNVNSELFVNTKIQKALTARISFSVNKLIAEIYHYLSTAYLVNMNSLLRLFTKLSLSKPLINKANILIFNWRDTKHKWQGGAEVYVQEIAEQWVRRGYGVTIFCSNDGNSKYDDKIRGVNIIRRGGFFTLYLWAAIYYLLRLRKQTDFIIDCENGIPFFSPLYSTKPKILLIHHIHQKVFRENLALPAALFAMFLESKLMKYVYRYIKIVTISQSSREDIEEMIPSKKTEIDVVNPGINLENYSLMNKYSIPTFVYLGRLMAYKNIDVLIEAFKEVIKDIPNAKLIIAGRGPNMDSLKDLSTKFNINESIEFKGYITEEEKREILAKSWVLVQPSSFEGWGITVTEANASGTPVIASNTSGLRDSVVDGKSGLLVETGNVKELARVMIALTEMDGFRERISKNAYELSQNYSWDVSAEKFLNIMISNLEKTQNAYLPAYVYQKINI